MKLFGTIFFACVCFFAVWVLLASTPLERINRSCTPVTWVGRAMTTVGSFVSSRTEGDVQDAGARMFGGCRVFIFRQFYAEELKRLQQLREGDGDGQGSSGVGQ